MVHSGVPSSRGLSVQSYRTVFARAPDVCVAVEPGSGRIVKCNDAVRSLLGFSPRELVGRSVLELAHPDSTPLARLAWQTVADDLSCQSAEVPVRRKDGSKMPARLTAARVQDDHGRVSLGVALLRSLARPGPQCALEDSPERMRVLLYALSVAEERERQRIAAGLHDDLGQWLAIAKLKLGRLGATRDDAERARLTEDVRSLVDRASRAARSTTFELGSPLLRQLGFDAAVQSVGERLQDHVGLRFHFHAADGPPPLPEDTLIVLVRVVRELLFNVHKHARATHVEVRTSRDAGGYRIEVSDDGIGFHADERLPPFGAMGGFGLFSAEAQVRAIGGRLAIDSAPGAGTRVVITVPCPVPRTGASGSTAS